jgi:dTDP-4-amino-4,6-dideoxygalactose transaminase
MIKMNDFRAEPQSLRDAELNAVKRVLESGWYVLGREVNQFESLWAEQCGVQYAVGVGNGMDAIEIGLRALGIGPGDEVITTAMTAFASVLAIIRAGATPVLADIDPETALLSLSSVERCIGSKTKAVLLVHLYGQLRDLDLWVNFCRDNKIHLLEDCAQSHLAMWGGKIAGSFGTLGAYSFYPTKNLGAIGDAGALVTDSIEVAKLSKSIRNYGQSERYHHPLIGLNSRLDEIHAAILSERLNLLESFAEMRRQIAEYYWNNISSTSVKTLAKPRERENHSNHLFVILTNKKAELINYLSGLGVESLSHYPIPIHLQEPCRNIKIDPMGLKFAQEHALQCLSIPCHPQMKLEDASKIAQAINAFT